MVAQPSWVVTIGDSYISGEGGRWAGNITGDPAQVDALGPDAYNDRRGGERIPGKNLACSGAKTRTQRGSDPFKPGIDFYRGGNGKVGQLVLLRRFAKTHDVSDVVVSIGGNDYGFASIVARCLQNFQSTAGTPVPDYCSDDEAVTQHFTPANVRRVTARITAALQRTAKAMRQAGYRPRQYSILVQNYPSRWRRRSGCATPRTRRNGVRSAASGDAPSSTVTRTLPRR